MPAAAAPPGSPRIQILIVDQQRAFRDVLAIRLRAEPDLVVGAQAQSAASARRVMAGRTVDVILLEADLPEDAAVAFCAEMSQRAPGPRVIMLSDTADANRIVAAVRAGAVGWVRKDDSVEHLLRVIRGVVRGEAWLPPAQLTRVLRLLIEDQEDRRDRDELLDALTPRERDVLFHLVDGAGRKEVAERLQLSENTVRTHLQSLMGKLGVHSTLEVVALIRPRMEALPRVRQLPRRMPAAGSGRLETTDTITDHPNLT
jgi:DNA-binding NarL/FixJ family response regulator